MKTATLATRRWWYIMPIVFITYSLAYLDRANYGFAAASGMAADLMITPGLSSMLGALFFLGYFFFQVPGAIYAQKHSVKKLIFVSLILWGGLATLDRRGLQRLLADRHPLHARRGRSRGDAGDAGLPVPLVHPCRALAGQHLSDPRQPGDHAVDVGGVGLSGAAFQLALDVHHRRLAGGALGVYLVASGR
jgi:hypothetical protein